ncbi:protein kinase [Nocardia sp. CDC153]|uniref:serine/threonine-protein kinase n=1 Tax=Nocardia sp. CDC153 TaxID=3112167 RepID=UPI002DB66CA5|nr:protein kinase [Nocardia sp. CDC153]MEC3952237.1 protein kinase [Nocardia sp. CDC153]
MRSGDVFAGYVIERELGRGGMGSVYLAKHPRLPRMTALKLLNQEMFADDEIRARFIREADLVARLDHPNIVTVYDRGDEGEQLWISMQYIDGVNASSIAPGTLPPLRAAQIIAETAKALDYAHGLGVLHRDVKPANILLARSSSKTGAAERVYLTDFGIARLRDDTGHLTQTGTVTATLAYASPEQLTGASLDGRSDQYSLACTLFQLLTGAVPFEGTSPAAVIRGHLQQPPPPASPLRQHLPPAIDAVLTKALSKRPAERFRSCVEFAAAAERALQTPRPVTPPRPPTPAHPQPIVAPRPPTPVRPQPVIQPPPNPTPSAPRPLVGPGPAYPNQRPASGPAPTYPVPPVSGPSYPNQQVSTPAYPNQPAPQTFSNPAVAPTPNYNVPTYPPRTTPPPTYPPPQKNSNATAWLIAAIVAVLVIVIIVIAVIVSSL